jgi:hypothetical protein
MDAQQPTFDAFLGYFPPVELPFTLGEDTHHLFSSENLPLPALAIAHFILPIEEMMETDELIEFVPCFALPTGTAFHAIVYWKADLLDYQYRLATFNKQGQLVAARTIAGMTYDGEEITQTMASIQEDMVIYMVSGQRQADTIDYAAAASTATRLQVATDGTIVEL